ncbi:hypothetical protein [Mycolicibacterium thermoresistibile]
MTETGDGQMASAAGQGAAPNRGFVISIVALMVAVAALGAGVWALLRDTDSPSQPSYTDEQRTDAKTAACEAFDTVRRGVSINSNRAAPGGEQDIVGQLAVAANARMSLLGGGQYLLAVLDPATPEELHDQLQEFAVLLMDIGAASTAGQPTTEPAQADRMRRADEMSQTIVESCR